LPYPKWVKTGQYDPANAPLTRDLKTGGQIITPPKPNHPFLAEDRFARINRNMRI